MTIGEQIKKTRTELKEDQSTFGKRFGVSHASISDMERGKSQYFHRGILNFIFNLEQDYENEINDIKFRLENIEGFLNL